MVRILRSGSLWMLAADTRSGRLNGSVELRVVLEDRALESLQLVAELEPELLVEVRARVAVGGERVGLAAAAVERQHQLAAETLTERRLGDEPLELGHDLVVTTERKLGVDAQLLGLQA